MTLAKIRAICLKFPETTERIQWGDNLVFKVCGKIFAIASTDQPEIPLSFKCSDEDFAELIEQEGIIPAPYLARAKWVYLEKSDILTPAELARRLRISYDLVVARLPRKDSSRLRAETAHGTRRRSAASKN
jgi:predicted DNA-binding protein (MmcQ/YjbR family)